MISPAKSEENQNQNRSDLLFSFSDWTMSGDIHSFLHRVRYPYSFDYRSMHSTSIMGQEPGA